MKVGAGVRTCIIRFEINGIMGIGVAFKRRKCFIELRKEHNKCQNLV